MKVCVISTTIIPCPPPGYSGLEMIAWQTAQQLSKRGHEVTLIAPIGSTMPDEKVKHHGTTLGESEMQAYSGYWDKLPGFDVVVDHSWNKWSYILKAEGKLKAPVLSVMHAPAETMFASPPPVPKPCLIAISKDQAGAIAGHLGIDSRVCYNGVDTSFYRNPGTSRNDRYLFLGRMSKLKGPHIAAAVARRCGVSLDLVGDDKLVENPAYVAQVKSMCTGTQVVYHGEKARAECVVFFSGAKAMLHCNAVFREPFGLAPVEAQLCGTPVIAFDTGAMRETINHGKTGFLVRTMDEMQDLVRQNAVADLSPKAIRAWAEQFSVENMGKRYEELCKEAVETGGW